MPHIEDLIDRATFHIDRAHLSLYQPKPIITFEFQRKGVPDLFFYHVLIRVNGNLVATTGDGDFASSVSACESAVMALDELHAGTVCNL